MGARFSALVQTGPGVHPASCTMGTGSFPGLKNGRGVTLTPHPILVLWSWKGRAIPLLPLWAVRPVQSLSACTRGALYLFTRHCIPEGIFKFITSFQICLFCTKGYITVIIIVHHIVKFGGGHAVAQLVEALHYKSEGRWFDSRWCHWKFSLT